MVSIYWKIVVPPGSTPKQQHNNTRENISNPRLIMPLIIWLLVEVVTIIIFFSVSRYCSRHSTLVGGMPLCRPRYGVWINRRQNNNQNQANYCYYIVVWIKLCHTKPHTYTCELFECGGDGVLHSARTHRLESNGTKENLLTHLRYSEFLFDFRSSLLIQWSMGSAYIMRLSDQVNRWHAHCTAITIQRMSFWPITNSNISSHIIIKLAAAVESEFTWFQLRRLFRNIESRDSIGTIVYNCRQVVFSAATTNTSICGNWLARSIIITVNKHSNQTVPIHSTHASATLLWLRGNQNQKSVPMTTLFVGRVLLPVSALVRIALSESFVEIEANLVELTMDIAHVSIAFKSRQRQRHNGDGAAPFVTICEAIRWWQRQQYNSSNIAHAHFHPPSHTEPNIKYRLTVITYYWSYYSIVVYCRWEGVRVFQSFDENRLLAFFVSECWAGGGFVCHFMIAHWKHILT